MMRTAVLLIALILSSACSRSTTPETPAPPAPPPVDERAQLLQVPATQAALPTVVGEGTLWRQGEPGAFTSVEVTNVFGFVDAPRLGSKVAVVPDRADLPAIELAVRDTRLRDDSGDPAERWHEVDLELVTQPDYARVPARGDRAPAYPGTVLLLHPAVPASHVALDSLQAEQLPAGVIPGIVRVAASLDADPAPEALIVEFCCADRARSEGCDLFCGERYLHDGQRWNRVSSSQPM